MPFRYYYLRKGTASKRIQNLLFYIFFDIYIKNITSRKMHIRQLPLIWDTPSIGMPQRTPTSK